MKIFVNARFLTQPLSGVQRYGIECSRQIKKLHPDVTFIAPKNLLHKDIADELNVITVGYNTGHLWEQLDLPLYMAKKKHAPLLNLANTAPLLYSNNYITIHDLAFYHHPEWNSKKFAAWYNILIPRLALGSKHIFTVSKTISNEIANCYHIPPAKISVAFNGISQKMLSYGSRSGTGKEKIIFAVGTFNIRKNHSALISAYLNSSLNNEYQLVILGDRNKVFRNSELDEKALAENNVRIYETLNEEELIAMYRRSEIVVSLSLYEGFGIPVLEGLYHGCKVVCSDIPVYRELYEGYVSFCAPANINNILFVLGSVKGASAIEKKEIDTLLGKYNYANSARIILQKILAK